MSLPLRSGGRPCAST